MVKTLSRDEFVEVARKPKRRFKVMAIGAAGSTRLRSPVAAPSYWFERHEEVVDAAGDYTVNARQATITMVVDGVPSVLFYLSGSRLESSTFAFTLTPHQLANAVAALKRARLRSIVPDAARSALENLPEGRRPVLDAALRMLASQGRRGGAERGPSRR